MDHDTIEYERSVYTVWDWMGDVGGLFGTLSILGYYIVSIASQITGNSLVREMIENLFLIEASKRWTEDADIGTWLRRRKPVKFVRYNLLKCSRDKTHHQLKDKVEKELDIIEYLKKQMINEVSQRLLFTRLQRHLFRHQASAFVLPKKSEKRASHLTCDDKTSSSWEPVEYLYDEEADERNTEYHR